MGGVLAKHATETYRKHVGGFNSNIKQKNVPALVDYGPKHLASCLLHAIRRCSDVLSHIPFVSKYSCVVNGDSLVLVFCLRMMFIHPQFQGLFSSMD